MESKDWVVAPFRAFLMVIYGSISFFFLMLLAFLFLLAAGAGIGHSLFSDGMPDIAGLRELQGEGMDESAYRFVSGNADSANLLLSIPVRGIILGSSGEYGNPLAGWGGVSFGYDIRKILDEAAERDDISGVFLHMQTPGGTIFGSMAIHRGMMDFKEKTGKPVVAFVEGISASGGVMSMAGADAVLADYGSIVGSIGILGPQLLYFDRPVAVDGGIMGGGVETEGGIHQTIFYSGRGKDFGNPFREPTKEEKDNMQQSLDVEYDRFVAHVAAYRNISAADLRHKYGARIFGNAGAEAAGLIDATMDMPGAVNRLAELAGVGGDYQLVRPREERPSFWRKILFSTRGADVRRPGGLRGRTMAELRRTGRIPLAFYGSREDLMAFLPPAEK